MNCSEFMRKTGVTKKSYVDKWLNANLIPGVEYDGNIDTAVFPPSARRPYCNRWLRATSDAASIRSHIIKACINRCHISASQCYMSKGEFDTTINLLVEADLIVIRVEDGITYYDSTPHSDQWRGKSLALIKSMVEGAITAASEGVTRALTTPN